MQMDMMAKLNTRDRTQEPDSPASNNAALILAAAALGLTGLFVFGFDETSRTALKWIMPVGSIAALTAAIASIGKEKTHGQIWLCAGTLGLFAVVALAFEIVAPLTILIAVLAFSLGGAFGFGSRQVKGSSEPESKTKSIGLEFAAALSGGEIFKIDRCSNIIASSQAETGKTLVERIHLADRPAFLLACDQGSKSKQPSTLRFQQGVSSPYFETEFRFHSKASDLFVAVKPAADLNKNNEVALRELAHELRTPLAAIVGLANALREDVTCNEKMRESYPGLIAAAGLNLIEMTSKILEGNIEKADQKQTSLGEIAAECFALLLPVAQEKSITLFNRLPQAISEQAVDGHLMRQIVLNLVTNAVKFSQPGASVELTAQTAANGWSLYVADNGSGMSPDVIARLGQRNFRGDNSDGVDGYGLGLSIVRRLVEEMGASINFESRPGKGTKVRITFLASKLVDLTHFKSQAMLAQPFDNAAGAKHAAA